jgi:hypothetical protein
VSFVKFLIYRYLLKFRQSKCGCTTPRCFFPVYSVLPTF